MPGGEVAAVNRGVVLVSMPFMDPDHPSIQLGLLKAAVQACGFPASTLHANLDFAARIGIDYYRRLCRHRGVLVGDWLFAREAFGEADPDPDARLPDDFAAELGYLCKAPDADAPQQLAKMLRRTRERDVPAYLDALADSDTWEGVRVVGFSSTFQQNAASFALARRLKRRYPGIVTVFGGANFDGDMGMELVRTVDCVDVAVVGEGEVAFPRLLRALAEGTDPGRVPGVAYRRGGRVHHTPPAPMTDRLDDSPVPDYDEYFRHAQELGLLAEGARRRVWIPVETARGCWWGAKHHCTFCGLNGTTMRFRSKSPRRVLDELGTQARRYRSFRFTAVDNILDMAYLTALFPQLVDSGATYELFYEVKSNLTRAQLRLLAQAGVTRIQPGIESLCTRVLGLMRKGVTSAANVNLLRWARYYGIDVAWNILWGFPGEQEQDYAEQSAAARHLRHLQPPLTAGRVWLERFSPLFTDPETFRIRSRAPEPSYRYVYPAGVDLDRVAYFFEYTVDGALPDSAYGPLRDEVREWSGAWRSGTPPVLRYWSAPQFLQIYDGRRPGREGTYTFEGMPAAVYLACSDRPTTAAAIRDRVDPALPVPAVVDVLREFQRLGLVFLDGPRALALALPAVAPR